MAKLPGKFSIITIVNKKNVFKEFKSNLLKQKNVDYELIRINNDRGEFNSAREAYNLAAEKANGDYLVFVHPDIRFLDELALFDILRNIRQMPTLGIAGIAGVPEKLNNGRYRILTTMIQGKDRSEFGIKIKKPVAVQTVDECFFVMKKSFWKENPFSNIKGWHLYAVEECLKALIDGRKNYVIPARVWHLSDGVSEDTNYIKIGRRIVKEYRNNFPTINTTVYKWDTHGLRRYYMPWFHYMDHKVARITKKYPRLNSSLKKFKHIFVKP